MANTQISPGVLVQERDLTNTINATIDNVGAMVGTFSQGPVEEIVTVSSERELIEVFGEPNDQNFEYWFSIAQFMLYGGTVKVVRADNSALKNAIDTATFTATTFTGTDTTLSVLNATGFDISDRLVIDAEILVVTAVSGNDLTVTRGQFSTSQVSHAGGSQVTQFKDAGSTSPLNQGGTLAAATTTITVTSVATLGAVTNSYIEIGTEVLQVTGVSGNDLTVTRGQLQTTATAHTDATAIKLLTVNVNQTTINEQTSTGVTPPLIKNADTYESTTEYAANNWKFAARTPGTYGNSIRILVTDAGPDQVLFLNEPGTDEAEWQMTPGKKISYSAANIYGQIFSYSLVLTLKPGVDLVGEFKADNFFTADSGNVTGRILAYEPSTRKLELTVDSSSSRHLDVDMLITELADNGGSAGSATGNTAKPTLVQRRVTVVLDEGSKSFYNNVVIKDSSTLSGDVNDGNSVTIGAVESEYASRVYGNKQKWSSVAPRPGTSVWATERGGFRDLMHVLVIDGDGGITGVPGSVLEKFLDVSKAADARTPQGGNLYYKDVIKASSSYIFWGAHESTQVFDVNVTLTGDVGGNVLNRKFDLFKNTYSILSLDDPTGTSLLAQPLVNSKNTSTLKYQLRGGADGYSAERDKLFDSYDLFSDPETEEIDYVIMGPALSNDEDSVAKAQKMIDLAETRGDCLAFVSAPRDAILGVPSSREIVSKTVEYFDKLSSSSYVVFDNNYKYIYDKYNDKYRYIPCNPDIAGLVLDTAIEAEPWFSPAGFTRGQIRNAVKLAYSPLKEERDNLYSARVNPIVAFPGEGIVLFGDKTGLSTPSAFDRINVRRLFLVIERAISDAAKAQLFEINDEFTRQSFNDIVDPYLRGVQSRRGVEDYLVVCDSSNNPDDAIDRGEFFAEIFVKPTRSINFITLRFTATRTGASFAEIVG
jgi:hypothetical protein